MDQATVDRALKALSEMGAAPSVPAERIPPMPQGVRLVRWEPKPAPVLLTTASVVTDVDQFIRATLNELGAAMRSRPTTPILRSRHARRLRDLTDRLEQVGVIVQVSDTGGTVCR